VDLECSHTTIAKDWRKKERIINVHTHTQKYKKQFGENRKVGK
jgi:hypothetical protein